MLSVPNANTMGAIDTKGTATLDDDEVAGFSIREPNVKYLAPGVDISVSDGVATEVVSGTGWFMRSVVPVLYADANWVRKLLSEMIPGVWLSIDRERSVLIVHWSDGQIEQVRELLNPGERSESELHITVLESLGPVEAGTLN